MFNLSYNLSSKIKENIGKIESLRVQILLTPLPLAAERELRWEASLNRVYWNLSFVKNPLSKEHLTKILVSYGTDKTTETERLALNFKKAIDLINENWLASPKKVDAGNILSLYQQSFGKLNRDQVKSFQDAQIEIDQVLLYIQSGHEHPVIQAGIACLLITLLAPFGPKSDIFSRITALLFLYKTGFDTRGLLVIAEVWRKNMDLLTEAINTTNQRQNLTLWLEYFSECITMELEHTNQKIISYKDRLYTPQTFWKINERQKEIIKSLESPEATTTNRSIQKLFGISQITASRDLTKLVNLGLLSAQGRGRSVRYYKP